MNSIGWMGTQPVLLLAGLSATFYAVAMVAMKHWSDTPGLPVAALIAGCMILGVVCEVLALRSERLGMIYLLILGAEVIVIAFAAWFAFGEQYTWREIVGGALVIAGTAIAWS